MFTSLSCGYLQKIAYLPQRVLAHVHVFIHILLSLHFSFAVLIPFSKCARQTDTNRTLFDLIRLKWGV